MSGAGRDHIPIGGNGARRADLGEDEHVPVSVRSATHADDVRNQSAHQRVRCHRGVPRMHGD